MMDPYRYICDNAYFAFKFGRTRSADAIKQILIQKTMGMKSEAASNLAAGFTEDQHKYYLRRLEEALATGTNKGVTLVGPGRGFNRRRRQLFCGFPGVGS